MAASKGISAGTMTVAILAILAGLVGAYMLRVFLQQPEEEVEAPPPTRNVPLASGDLPSGRELALGDIGLRPMTTAQMNEENMPLSLVMMSPEQIIGRVTKVPIKQGQPFLSTDLYLDGDGPNPAANLKPGFRAVTLQTDYTKSAGVESGMYIDVLFRANPQPATSTQAAIPEATVTLLEGVKVLDIRRNRSASSLRRAGGGVEVLPAYVRDQLFTTATLEVSLKQASMLETVDGEGEISLIPRASQDSFVTTTTPQEKMTLRELLGIQPPPPPVLPFMTEIYNRGRRSVNVFPGLPREVGYADSGDGASSPAPAANDTGFLGSPAGLGGQ